MLHRETGRFDDDFVKGGAKAMKKGNLDRLLSKVHPVSTGAPSQENIVLD